MKAKLDRLLTLLREGKGILESLEEDDLLGSMLKKEGLPQIDEVEKLLIAAGAGTDDDCKLIMDMIPYPTEVALVLHKAVEHACTERGIKLIRFERIGTIGGKALVWYPTGVGAVVEVSV